MRGQYSIEMELLGRVLLGKFSSTIVVEKASVGYSRLVVNRLQTKMRSTELLREEWRGDKSHMSICRMRSSVISIQ